MNQEYKSDVYRYYGGKMPDLLHRLLTPPELKWLRAFRRASGSHGIMRCIREFRLLRLSRKIGIQIPARTKIGEGLFIGHHGRIIVNPDAVIGRNVNIATGVTIGAENRGARKGSPTIGDRCFIGTNAVIVGNIKIGSDVLIAPLAYVNFDVPDHSVVLGNPARIIARENATEAYVENTI